MRTNVLWAIAALVCSSASLNLQASSPAQWQNIYSLAEHALQVKSLSTADELIKQLEPNAARFGGMTYIKKLNRLQSSLAVLKAAAAGNTRRAESIARSAYAHGTVILPIAQEVVPGVFAPTPEMIQEKIAAENYMPNLERSTTTAGSGTPSQDDIQEEHIARESHSQIADLEADFSDIEYSAEDSTFFEEELNKAKTIDNWVFTAIETTYTKLDTITKTLKDRGISQKGLITLNSKLTDLQKDFEAFRALKRIADEKKKKLQPKSLEKPKQQGDAASKPQKSAQRTPTNQEMKIAINLEEEPLTTEILTTYSNRLKKEVFNNLNPDEGRQHLSNEVEKNTNRSSLAQWVQSKESIINPINQHIIMRQEKDSAMLDTDVGQLVLLYLEAWEDDVLKTVQAQMQKLQNAPQPLQPPPSSSSLPDSAAGARLGADATTLTAIKDILKNKSTIENLRARLKKAVTHKDDIFQEINTIYQRIDKLVKSIPDTETTSPATEARQLLNQVSLLVMEANDQASLLQTVASNLEEDLDYIKTRPSGLLPKINEILNKPLPLTVPDRTTLNEFVTAYQSILASQEIQKNKGSVYTNHPTFAQIDQAIKPLESIYNKVQNKLQGKSPSPTPAATGSSAASLEPSAAPKSPPAMPPFKKGAASTTEALEKIIAYLQYISDEGKRLTSDSSSAVLDRFIKNEYSKVDTLLEMVNNTQAQQNNKSLVEKIIQLVTDIRLYYKKEIDPLYQKALAELSVRSRAEEADRLQEFVNSLPNPWTTAAITKATNPQELQEYIQKVEMLAKEFTQFSPQTSGWLNARKRMSALEESKDYAVLKYDRLINS